MAVQGIDHVHIEVTDRETAAAWYARVLGLVPDERLAVWAEDPMGPLVLSTEGGTPVLSLFRRAAAALSRSTTVAYRVDAPTFLRFLDALPSLGAFERSGEPLTRIEAVDHQLSWSLYFADPDRNPIEVTTYAYDAVRTALGR